jgi:hypothetical protein
MKFVKINTDGEMFDMDESVNLRTINKLLSNDSSTKIQQLYTWNYENSTVVCYGCIEGNAGNENKHELPPKGVLKLKGIGNSDTQLLFGNIYMIKKDKKISNIDTSDYSVFYSTCFQGFDDCVSDEEEDEEDDEEDDNSLDGFIVQDDESQLDSDYELDEDNNIY